MLSFQATEVYHDTQTHPYQKKAPEFISGHYRELLLSDYVGDAASDAAAFLTAAVHDFLSRCHAGIGDSTSEEFLRSLGVGNYDVCIVALGGLFQSSLETTSLLRELGAKKVVSRATNDLQMKFLLRNAHRI